MISLIIVGALAFAPRTSSAQYNTAEISGVVRDVQGGALPGARVSATNGATRFTVERVSDGAGRFFLPALPVGVYTLATELAGFRQFSERGLTLGVGARIDLVVTLQLGQLTDTVTVTANPPLLRTANAELAEVIDNRQVEQLPLNGRQFIQLAQLTDGVTIPPGGTRGAALGQAGPLPNVYGQRGGHNIYLLDGVKVTDELFNNLVVSPSVDAIQEFKISKTMYPAEFGGKASALINVVTKSGSNRVHGSGLEFLRDERFDSHNFFADPARPN
ncbi:MAG: carboxypeptidase-like regulatory domain-containing protein, partial [Vicinamibacterales bacterium]